MVAVSETRVRLLENVTDDELNDIAILLPQLSKSAVFDADRVRAMLASPDVFLYAAVEDGRIVGLVTLLAIPQITGVRGHIEDVVVDEGHRGRGIARSLLEAAIVQAAKQGARTLDLTSRPSRESAHRLYESLGFVIRNTDVMRLTPQSC